MSVLSKLRGTLETFFQVGGTGGSGWNLNGAVLEARNAANSAFVIVRGLTPVGVADLVTKAYADALALVGDVGGTAAANVVNKITGASAIVISQPQFVWNANTGTVSISQATPASDVATTDIVVSAQGPFASAVTNTRGGNVRFRVLPPVGAANESGTLFDRNGTVYGAVQPRTGFPAISGRLWLGPNSAAQTNTNYALECQATDTYLNTGGSLHFSVAAGDVVSVASTLTVIGSNGSGHSAQFFGGTALGGGVGVIGIHNASANPTTNPSAGVVLYSELTTGHLKNRGSLGAVTTMAPAGSSGTISSQKQISDLQMGTCQTVSSATPTAILAYTTTSGTGGLMRIVCVSRATTTGAGIAVGDVSTSTYEVSYKNVAGTVTLDTTGITVQGTARTTAAALTVPVLTASVATNVVTILVTNVNLCTVDSQVEAMIFAA